MSLVIREAVQRDARFIQDCQMKMALETENLNLDNLLVEKGVLAVLRDSTKGRYYLAETEGGVAVACLLTIPEWSDWRNGTVLWIHSLYVIPSERKSGVFKSMYAYLKNKVESSDAYRGVRLYVDKRNELAKQAYVRAGMSAEHYDLYEWLK